MPLQLLSRPTTETVHSRSPSPLTTPASKPPIPSIFLTSATPCDANPVNHVRQVAPWVDSETSRAPIAPKPTSNGDVTRRRLVPKKSKLGLLGSSSAKAREQDLSDVVRRVGGSSLENANSAFEIYVDPTNDPDLGEILMVKKKKSRLALNGLEWGTLGEVTNVPSVAKSKEKRTKKDSILKLKVDENQKWWSIGRGRKDSKEKDKGKGTDRASSPQPIDKPVDRRIRFNSLDSGVLLSNAVHNERANSPADHPRVPTPPPATRAPAGAAASGTAKDSVALRAMRSVRSLARIGSWAQLKNMPNLDAGDTTTASAKDKDQESDGKKKRKKKDKKEKEKDGERKKETIRHSGSSFEAGTMTASPAASKHSKSLGKKASILGLGLPSSIRLPTKRSGSTASSIVAADPHRHRLSVDSATLLGGGILARGRSGSTMSTTSSPRPMSTLSCGSRQSSGSSGGTSVKWDEAGLETVKEIRRKDKEIRRKEQEKEKEESQEKKSKKLKTTKESTRKLSDSRRRTPLSAIFPGSVSAREEDERDQPPVTPAITNEETSRSAGKYCVAAPENSPTETPMKRMRLRPSSDQPLGHYEPRPLYDGGNDNAAMSLLDAATNDLAQLINHLDLEATPGTPTSQRSALFVDPTSDSSPRDRFTIESPVKKLRRKNSSITTLKPCTESYSTTDAGVQLGQNIAPWATLNASISPSKSTPSTIRANSQDHMATVRTHRRSRTPTPVAEPSPVFKALRPATNRLPISKTAVCTLSGISSSTFDTTNRSPSSLISGSSHSTSGSYGSLTASPVFKRVQSQGHKKSSVPRGELGSGNLPILPEVRRNLGLAGTMGSSVGSIAEQGYDGSGPDSDIPKELQVILSNSDQEEDTISFKRQSARPSLPSPGLPPEVPLPALENSPSRNSLAGVPVFCTTMFEDDEHHVDVDEAGTLSEDDTKRSFDFTGELQRLNESGVSDRRSFIEQLENAFRTPAKLDLRYDFESLPPVPKLATLQDNLPRTGEISPDPPGDSEPCGLSPEVPPVDVHTEQSLLTQRHSLATTASDEELLHVIAPQMLRNVTSVASRPSNGELNRDFKFGGKEAPSKPEPSPLTLSDIIPPPEVARSLAMVSFAGNESSLINSVIAHSIQVESPLQIDSNSLRNEARESARNSFLAVGHKRNSSGLSFAGFDSFAEIRRGFEYNDNRPGFYPPPASVSDRRRQKHESWHSIASVSSYGNVLYGGSADPFDYGSVAPLPSLRERPSSDEFSFTMSTAVDDTFSFVHRQPRARGRVDSDASSFYFRSSFIHPYNRSQRRPDSGMSIGPPISLFNRNSTYRRRSDSNVSISSTSNSYGNCRRISWTRHRSNTSVDSTLSDFSEMHLGRPGLGDKMLESAQDRVSPLPSVVVSPSPSIDNSHDVQAHWNENNSRTSYDSIMDSHYGSPKNDSLFEKTGHRISVPDSEFFEGHPGGAATKPPRYRPISSLSIQSVHSPPKEDDTMISMLGGGDRVRRRSITSMIGASPSVQVERRKNIVVNPPETVFSRIKNTHPDDDKAPEISRVIEPKLSIASNTDSVKFGDERMIRARYGLLERQSLENTALVGDGEELSGLFRMPVFTRPSCANRSRSSTCTSTSGVDTPPLSISDGHSSFSEGSLSSIDLSQLNTLLSNAAHPASNAALDRARPPARNPGHRRRISQARASRTSLYETIEEEFTSTLSPTKSPEPSMLGSVSKVSQPAEHAMKITDPPQLFVVDPETSSIDSFSLWDDEQGITALRRYYALRDEAEDAVTESRRAWSDTPLSVFTLQSFDPPRHRSGMKAMLEHSLRNFGPLPSDLRPHRARSRANSRPSPYPRTVKTSFSSTASVEHLRAVVAAHLSPSVESLASRQTSPLSGALQQIATNPNVRSTASAPSKDALISPDKPERVFGLRSNIGSAARRTGSGWAKKTTGRNGIENKENGASIANASSAIVNISHGTLMTPADGLRLNRPRPRARPTPASVRPLRA